jgi:NarL family two-component system sensor histidine kinase YdfH
MRKSRFLSRLVGDEHHFERPFFLFLTVVMIIIYITALISSPLLRTAWKIVLFTLLMAGHIGLYWFAPWVFRHLRWLVLYLVVQLATTFSLGMLCQVWGVVFGLYPGLIGLFISTPVRRIWRLTILLFILAVSALNFALVSGLKSLLPWMLGTIPIVIFVSLYVLMYVRQAEARERAQTLLTDLEVANRQLSGYAARVEDLTIAAERQRMARELHDTLSQGLAGLILQLEAVDAHLAGNRTERARAILEQSMQKARETLAEARQAIDDLRRPQATDLGEAVRLEAEHFRAATGIPCEPDFELPAGLPEAVSEAAMRAVSESLTNVARHARARAVSLHLAETGEGLEIEIRDDGIGFDPGAVEAGHYGLLGMRERVRLAGGSLEVQSGPGWGTRINIRFPLEKVSRV